MASHTERATCRITVKEGNDGPFLMFESGWMHSLGENGMITLDLRPGTTVEQARKIASTINESVVSVAVTFDVPEIKQSKPF